MKLRVLLLFLAMCWLCSGCGKASTSTSIFSNLSTEDGYSYPGLTWGMSIEETEKALGTQLEDSMRQTDSTENNSDFSKQEIIFLYPAEEEKKYQELCGATGVLSYQFLYGKLVCVSVAFKQKYGTLPENDLKKLSEDLLVQLEKALGEKPAEYATKPSIGVKTPVSHQLYEWSEENVSGSKTFVRISVISPINEDATPQALSFDVSQFTPQTVQ